MTKGGEEDEEEEEGEEEEDKEKEQVAATAATYGKNTRSRRRKDRCLPVRDVKAHGERWHNYPRKFAITAKHTQQTNPSRDSQSFFSRLAGSLFLREVAKSTQDSMLRLCTPIR